MSEKPAETEALKKARDEFISHWGTMGSAWGINRTMAQIHALLMVSERPLTTDEVMAELEISRGNAHQNLHELIDWGLVRSVIVKGERKDYYESEKDVWKMFCTIARNRKRREIEPVLGVLRECEAQTRSLKGEKAATFNRQVKALGEFVGLADSMMERISRSEQSALMPVALKFLGKKI
ncbi:DNA-binding transcriptional regulator GbsR, MarR family [Verrucomicrobium sp. GAS474]|uniref:GbsR/MarR family transcriptional regulator n=1 Tax=Verrucomicrobium sp. GAS474 TaxID=1882831 RepID=UPI00087A1BB4|nr:MarR family transcriptional regulator [Verrucomicrobium sp. GAS474]SDT91550.1 DNA-binding transcriptional regulator GbsR, MarR family [Verrucomicrobium sp. GAS474]